MESRIIKAHAGKSRPMKNAFLRKKSPFRIGFLAGLLAGIIASGVMFFISVTWNGILLPDVFGSELTALMPAPLFEFFTPVDRRGCQNYSLLRYPGRAVPGIRFERWDF